MTTIEPSQTGELGLLLRGEPESLGQWLERWSARRLLFCVTVISIGAGLYGAAMGCWRAPLQGLYVAIKFPLIILLTTVGNALLNAMLAPLLGLNISLRESFHAILMSFSIAAAILGSFSPLVAFLVWNAPPLSPTSQISARTYTVIQLSHVAVIGFAGVAANLRLIQLLRHFSSKTLTTRSGARVNVRSQSEFSHHRAVAQRVLLAWLAGNLFFGSQLSWILRPFIGSPELPVQFLRETAFKGNFYETVLRSVLSLLNVSS